VVKLGDERHIFDRRADVHEVQEIEKVAGSSFAEGERELGRYSFPLPGVSWGVGLRRRSASR
jgi:hypothetical protein